MDIELRLLAHPGPFGAELNGRPWVTTWANGKPWPCVLQWRPRCDAANTECEWVDIPIVPPKAEI